MGYGISILDQPQLSKAETGSVHYRNKNAVDNENIRNGYFPLSTAHHHYHIDGREEKENKA